MGKFFSVVSRVYSKVTRVVKSYPIRQSKSAVTNEKRFWFNFSVTIIVSRAVAADYYAILIKSSLRFVPLLWLGVFLKVLIITVCEEGLLLLLFLLFCRRLGLLALLHVVLLLELDSDSNS